MDIRRLQEGFTAALLRQWSFGDDYKKVVARTTEINEGKRPSSDLVILDDEFLGSGQLSEFALVEKVSGNVLIGTRVKYKDGLNLKSDKWDLLSEKISYYKARKLFGAKKLGVYNSTNGLNADEIAEILMSGPPRVRRWHAAGAPHTSCCLRSALQRWAYIGMSCPPLLLLEIRVQFFVQYTTHTAVSCAAIFAFFTLSLSTAAVP